MNINLSVLKTLFMRNERLSAFSIGTVLLVIVVAMGILSLTMLNDNATKGYLLNKVESERQELVEDGEITDMLTLRARSMAVIEESPVVQRMVKPSREDIVYVTPVTVVAQNH